MSETKFHTHTEPYAKLYSYYSSIFKVLAKQSRRHEVLAWVVAWYLFVWIISNCQ
jgi:hypothetical protein